MPLAYFITFTTYGVWLHGSTSGSVDKEHNEPGTAFLLPDPVREAEMRGNMRAAPYLLDDARRTVVLETVQDRVEVRRPLAQFPQLGAHLDAVARLVEYQAVQQLVDHARIVDEDLGQKLTPGAQIDIELQARRVEREQLP